MANHKWLESQIIDRLITAFNDEAANYGEKGRLEWEGEPAYEFKLSVGGVPFTSINVTDDADNHFPLFVRIDLFEGTAWLCNGKNRVGKVLKLGVVRDN